MVDKYAEAQQFMVNGHRSIDQRRKFSGENYEVHPFAVAELLKSVGITNESILIAALEHDLLEDVAPMNPDFGVRQIKDAFGWGVTSLVLELTDRFTPEAYPKVNRKERKEWERIRLVFVSDEAKVIKMADIVDNARSMPKDAGYWYKEKELLVPSLEPFGEEYLREAYFKLKAMLSFGRYNLDTAPRRAKPRKTANL